MRKALVSLAACMTLGTVMLSSPAQAAATPRLVGTWSVKATVTRSVNSVNPVGTVYTRRWVFQPQCDTGPCDTTLDRQRFTDSVVVRYTMKLVSDEQYKGARTYTSPCYDANGNVAVQVGYNNRETIVLNITDAKLSGGPTATTKKFVGTLVAKGVPTAAGEAENCSPFLVKAKLNSGRRTA